jgi:hypothetical protein
MLNSIDILFHMLPAAGTLLEKKAIELIEKSIYFGKVN